MRSARTLFASAAVTAVLAITAPAANAITLDEDYGQDSSSSSSGYGKTNKQDSTAQDSTTEDSSASDPSAKKESWKKESATTGDSATTGESAAGDSATTGESSKKESWKKESATTGESATTTEESTATTEESATTEAPAKKESWKKDKPWGGVHTGGGALAKVVAEDWGQDSGSSSESGSSWKKEKPAGGVHAGGGGLADSGGGLAAGSLLLLGGIGFGAYTLRRRNATSGAVA